MSRPYIYRMQRNHGSTIPRRIVFIDTETRKIDNPSGKGSWANSFRLVCATFVRMEKGEIVKEVKFRSESKAEFWEWLESLQNKRCPLWVFAHHLFFDWKILSGWDKLDEGEYTDGPIPGNGLDPRVRGSRPWRGQIVLDSSPRFLKLMGRKGRVNFVDSMNYIPKALSKVGESFDLNKTEWPGFDADTESLMDYCERDVEVLKHAMTSIMQRWYANDCGIWQMTASSLSLHSFQHQPPASHGGKLVEEIVFEDDQGCLDLERDGYYGGHFEAFYHGLIKSESTLYEGLFNEKITPNGNFEYGPIYHYDVCGLYPYVMRNGMFPVRRTNKVNNPSVDWLRLHAATGWAIATVAIHSLDDTFPIKSDRGQLHVCGHFTTTLAGEELRRAINSNVIKEVYNCITYRCEPIFRDWIDRWHGELSQARRQGDKVRAEFAKMLLVSLSGKWAQKSQRWVPRPNMPAIMRWGHNYRGSLDRDERTGEESPVRMFRYIAGKTYERVTGDTPRHCFPAISAFITSAGREYMRSLRMRCPTRSIWYQAADAIWVNFSAAEALASANLIGDNVLGKLKLEGHYDSGNIFGVNNLQAGEKTWRAGIPGKARRVEGGVIMAEYWEDVASAIGSKPDDLVRVQCLPVVAPRVHYKGKVGVDGWTTPIHMTEDPRKQKKYIWDQHR